MRTKGIIKGVIFVVGLVLSLNLCATGAYALPALPHAFYGSVAINGSPAPSGVVVEARGSGVLLNTRGNPITTAAAGQYGSLDGRTELLVVQGNINEGTIISFYINGIASAQTAAWKSGDITRLDLTVTAASPVPPSPSPTPPAPGGGGGGGGGGVVSIDPFSLRTNLFGDSRDYTLTSSGKLMEPMRCKEAPVSFIVPSETIMLGADGKPLPSLTFNVSNNPPPAPQGTQFVGPVFEFEPSGATFSPPLKMVFTYNEKDFPSGAEEEELALAYVDINTLKWVKLAGEVDTINNTLTVNISHFCYFAILSYIPAPAAQAPVPGVVPLPASSPAPTLTPAPTPSPTQASPDSATAAPPLAPPVAPSVPIQPAETTASSHAVASTANWPIVGGVIAGAIGAVLIVLILRRKAA